MPLFLCVCSSSLSKTLWEKEKLPIMTNFSFSHNVFYTSVEFSAIFIKSRIVWKSLKSVVWETINAFPNKPWFLGVCSISLLKTLWEKEQFLLFPQCFLSILENFLPLSLHLKLSFANSLNLGESKICHLGTGQDYACKQNYHLTFFSTLKTHLI